MEYKTIKYQILLCIFICGIFVGCAGPTRGPDKQFAGSLQGAAVGAGAGAVTGAQLLSVTGPGIAVGAGFGALAGGIQGFVKDQVEEEVLDLSPEIHRASGTVYAQEVLSRHYKKRMALHPSRDIFPADWFFDGDSVRLRREAVPIIREIAKMNKRRLPWSRLVIASYVKSSDKNSDYARYLAEERAKEVGAHFIREGIEPRRVSTRGVIVQKAVLIDPNSYSGRYNQAIELIPADR